MITQSNKLQVVKENNYLSKMNQTESQRAQEQEDAK